MSMFVVSMTLSNSYDQFCGLVWAQALQLSDTDTRGGEGNSRADRGGLAVNAHKVFYHICHMIYIIQSSETCCKAVLS